MTDLQDRPPPICGNIWVSGDKAVCTRETGHTGPHDNAGPGDAVWDVRVWDQT